MTDFSTNNFKNLDNADKTVILASMLESATILLLIYGYCVAGEYLITEVRQITDYCCYYFFCRSRKDEGIKQMLYDFCAEHESLCSLLSVSMVRDVGFFQ